MHCWIGSMHNMVYKSKTNEKNGWRFYNKEHWTLLKNSDRTLTAGRVTRRPTFISCSKMIWIHSDSSGSKRYHLHYMVWWQCVIMLLWTGYVSTVTSLSLQPHVKVIGVWFFLLFFFKIRFVLFKLCLSDLIWVYILAKRNTHACSLNVALSWYCCWQAYST